MKTLFEVESSLPQPKYIFAFDYADCENIFEKYYPTSEISKIKLINTEILQQ